MKLVKKITSAFLVLTVVFALNSCSGCDNENPSAKVTNNGTQEVSVQIKTSGGSTTNINNVAVGTSSGSVNYAPGEIVFTIILEDKTEVVETVLMAYCTNYEIAIDADNVITTTSRDED